MRQMLIIKNKWVRNTYVLPATSETNHTINILQKDFWIEDDVLLNLICVKESWICKATDAYKIVREGQLVDSCRLVDNDEFDILTSDGEQLNISVKNLETVMIPYQKLQLSSLHRIIISTGEKCDIHIDTATDALTGFRLRRIWNGWDVRSEGEGTVYLNGTFLSERKELKFGDVLSFDGFEGIYLIDELAIHYVGSIENDSLNNIFVNNDSKESSEKAITDKKLMPEKNYIYQPSARILPEIIDEKISIEELPTESEDEKKTVGQIILQSMMMVAPMMLGSVFIIFASKYSGTGGSLLMYASAVMALSSGIGASCIALYTYQEQQKKRATHLKHKYTAYREYILEKVGKIKEIYQHNDDSLRTIYPNTKECLDYNTLNGKLYGRTFNHSDFLKIRVGVGEIPSRINIEVPPERFILDKDEFTPVPEYIKKNYSTLYDAPILLNIGERPLIGIVGGSDKKKAVELARTIALQVAANHSYSDVKMAFMYDRNVSCDNEEWDFARYIPHAFADNRQKRLIGTCESEISNVSHELVEVFRTREERLNESAVIKNPYDVKLPHYILFISDLNLLRGQMLSHYIFSNSGNIGLTTIILSDSFSSLPNSCSFVLQDDSDYSGFVETIDNCQHRQDVTFDKVDKESFMSFCRYICGIKVAEYSSSVGLIPANVSFTEMYSVERIEDLNIYSRWQRNKVYESMRTLVGLGAGGLPVYLDVHEKYHGPHGLVAGTTGSGKSETLQSYLLSLAVEFSPDDISFLIIDYKGGGMANLFDDLPHMSGSISNLSGAMVRRAMVAIKSENKRRQRMFNVAGVNNINAYSELFKSGKIEEPIPHLFIVIDEFAELKREEPDFMKELISVAQVGRSLGVHLILSTQKPSGTVDDNIWSNSKFRLCLAVQTKEDSHDMLGKNDAAYITQVGRGYLQVGNDELYQLFQSGYSGGPYDPNNNGRKNATRSLTISGAEDIVATDNEAEKRKKKTDNISQFSAIKSYIAKLSSEKGYAPVHKLWLPVLKKRISLDEINGYETIDVSAGAYNPVGELFELNAVVGLVDDPVNQSQNPLVLDFAKGGHHGIIGLTQTGKSTLLQTIIYSLVNKYPPNYLNIYCLDYSSRALSPFEDLNHIGGVIYEQDEDKLERFMFLIDTILEERKKEFRGGNFGQFYRANGLTCPAIVVAIDNYSAFESKSGGKYFDTILKLAKEGEANGIYLLISAAGIGMNEISSRLAGSIKSYICLALKDKYAYTDFLRVLSVDVLPEDKVPGRGLCVYDGRILEYQAALSTAAEDDYSRINEIKNRCSQLNELSMGMRARQIPNIPKKPNFNEFSELAEVKEAINTPELVPIGYDTKTAMIYSISLVSNYCYLIAGSKKSARTNLQVILLNVLAKKKGSLVYIGKDKFFTTQSVNDKLIVLDNKEAVHEYFGDNLTAHYKRVREYRNKLLESGMPDEIIIRKIMDEFEPVYIIIRDLMELSDMIRDDTDSNDYLKYIFQKGRDHLVYFFGAIEVPNRNGLAFSTWLSDFTSYKSGIHLGGNITDNNYLDFRYMKFSGQSEIRKDNLGQISDSIDEELSTTQVIIPSVYSIEEVGDDN